MQRWIVIAALVLCLVGAGGVAAMWNHRQNKPDMMYLQLPIDQKVAADARKQFIDDLRRKLLTPEVLAGVARDCGVQAKLKLGSEQETIAELQKRGFVEDEGVHLHVGFRGKRKEHDILAECSTRLGEDLKKLLTVQSTPAPAKDPLDF